MRLVPVRSRFSTPTPLQRSIPRRRSKSAMGYFVVFFMLFAAGAALITAVIDPLQFYHRPSWYVPLLSEQERYQNPGLALHYDYDTIIIGTSMTENFLPSETGQALGGTVLKLSMEGSTVDEHYKMAALALRTGKVKQVLWGLDYFSLKLSSGADSDFPDYLYDGKLWTDYRYWFNYSVYKQFGSSLKAMLAGESGPDLEHLNNWDSKVTYGRELVAKSFLKAGETEQYFGLNEENVDELKEHFNTYILPLVKDYPDVKFMFYYPPYSIMRQTAWYAGNPERFANQLIMRKWMYEQFKTYSNVRLYDFQTAQDWTFNLDLYKDLSHHSGKLNQSIAEAIGRDDPAYRVTDLNVDALNELLDNQAKSAAVDAEGNVKSFHVLWNGKPFTYSCRYMQQNELWISAKEAGAKIGADVVWDADTRTAALSTGSHSVQFRIGSKTAIVNGTVRELKSAPLLLGGKALVPLSFVAEAFGNSVSVAESGDEIELIISGSD
ncbi:copper amine oxidase N-terminal domain-containing protein [Paenibacillus sp. HN-1]|uniref:copper amine oxidase N-terminal domain-containing protein n=1 Tax=Paenibacillus TaxID=44249 RepID=UPI001CA9483E|nr:MULTISPECIES: copper amine oxidase N-terminal domain-containing protein [Paenibacillus]MBY9081603.1 copper amine oxidase N-terminal domain-containing protein [Paenibacillus sp. CGMCC 1.18879]MBY9083472.1 copper amine oxidase N-terminal domain-containing protein [Paenibacillus sinensis]